MSAAAARCRERIQSLFGDELAGNAGVFQVVSTWMDPSGVTRVIAVGDAAPKSSTDRFCLNLARSRADAVVTTGHLLRCEPLLTHATVGPDEERNELRAWRREVLERNEPPLSVVLTRGRDLDLSHPLFNAGNPCAIYTGEGPADEIRNAASALDIEVVGAVEPSLRSVLTWLRERGAQSLLVEAGPNATRGAYEDPVVIEEVLHSVFQEEQLAAPAQGPRFLSCDDLRQRGFETLSQVERQEQSGSWRFERLRRPAT